MKTVAPGPIRVEVQAALDTDTDTPLAGAVVEIGGRAVVTPFSGRAIFDGVPAGEYDFTVRARSYTQHRARLTVPRGTRQPLTVTLDPAPTAPVSGKVTLTDSSKRDRHKLVCHVAIDSIDFDQSIRRDSLIEGLPCLGKLVVK